MKRKILLVTALFIVLGLAIVWNSIKTAEAGRIEFLTYYPSPFGIYDRIRLHPRAELNTPGDEPCQIGTLYVNTVNDALYMCQDIDGTAVDDSDGKWGLASPWKQGTDAAGNNPYVSLIDPNPDLFMGIGTADPTQRLHVTHTANANTGVIVENMHSGVDSASMYQLKTDNGIAEIIVGGSGTADYYIIRTRENSSYSNLWIQAHNATDTGIINLDAGPVGLDMTITSNGNVGIGTASPNDRLEVNGGMTFGGTVGINKGRLYTNGASALPPGLTEEIVFGFGAAGTDESRILIAPNSTCCNGTVQISATKTIIPNGNVGIGTNVPAATLHVDGLNMRFERSGKSIFFDPNNVAVNTNAQIKTGLGMGLSLYTNASDIGTGGTLGIYMSSTGNVGIGTGVPAGKLDVDGAIYQRGGSLHADYVFEPDYQLEDIAEHTAYMWENKHLKSVPKVRVDEKGQEFVDTGQQRRGMLEELEKAHIYIDQLHIQINAMKKEFEERIMALEDRH